MNQLKVEKLLKGVAYTLRCSRRAEPPLSRGRILCCVPFGTRSHPDRRETGRCRSDLEGETVISEIVSSRYRRCSLCVPGNDLARIFLDRVH